MNRIINLFFAGWLVWNAALPEQQVTRYNIYREQGNSEVLIAMTTPPSTRFEYSDFLQGSRTVFCITAINSNGESLISDKVTVQKK